MQTTEAHHIETIVITGTDSGPHLLISGGVHGDEYESMAAIRRLQKEIRPESLSGKVTLAPVMNEPAFENYARTGPDGLDLARIFPGTPEGSISERVACAGAQLIESADYYIDLHTGGLAMKILPMSGYVLHADPEILDTQRRMARAFNLPVIWGTHAGLDGRSLSIARDANIPAIYAEWGGGGGCDPVGVEDYVNGCLNVIAELGMLERNPPESRVEHVAEDNRPNAGYMQINYNSQSSGYFEPAAKLGDMMRTGGIIGTILSPAGDIIESMPSIQTGLLLTLRALPRVEKGDCLAVIIDMEI
jgi:predicted deacylase